MLFKVSWRSWLTQLAHNEKIAGSSPAGTTEKNKNNYKNIFLFKKLIVYL